MPFPDAQIPRRQSWMAVLARASQPELVRLLQAAPPLPAFTRLRAPEAGLAMVRGRTGGGGAPFNLGEITITRCSVRDTDGHIGHAYVKGRDAAQAELAARLDAVLQDASRHDDYAEAVIAPLAELQTARAAQSARKAAATRVQFFTLATMRST